MHRRTYFAAIDLPSLLEDALLASRTPPSHIAAPDIIWQAVLLTPDPWRVTKTDHNLLEWLNKKLTLCPPEETSGSHPTPLHTLSVTSSPLHRRVVSSTSLSSGRLRISVKHFCPGATGGDKAEGSYRRELLGTSAILLYVPTPEAGESPEVIMM